MEIKGNEFISNLNKFESQINKMNSLYDEVIEKAKNMQNDWMGNDSDEEKMLIDGFIKTFENKRMQYSKFVRFLKMTIEQYSKQDEETKNSTESESFSINGS